MACGIFGVLDLQDNPIFLDVYWGLRALNHRGHQSWKIVTHYKGFFGYGGLGLVPPLDQLDSRLKAAGLSLSRILPGSSGVGNTRYTTFGKGDPASLLNDAQPFTELDSGSDVTISYNGNIVNADQLKLEIVSSMGPLSTSSDTELINKKLIKELTRGDMFSAVENCMEQIEGAYSIVGLKGDDLFAFRDPCGIRPLCLGCNRNKTKYVFASETPALEKGGFEFDSFVEPGECVLITSDGMQRKRLSRGRKAFCAFEIAYFSRPESLLSNGRYVYEVREDFGRSLARENPDVAKRLDAVISIPETADDASYGFHDEIGIAWERAVRRDKFVSERAFIKSPDERIQTIKRKITIVGERLKGKNIGCVDDSIVRGDTTRNTIREIKKFAREVHLFITFPKIVSVCPYGIDMATFEELIAARKTEQEIAKDIGADSLHYQTVEGFLKASGFDRTQLCLGCITREYPTPYAEKLINEKWRKSCEGFLEKGRIYE
ncbi:MAG: amidophosphoribosyltransferase [Nitrososphaeria archaeon]